MDQNQDELQQAINNITNNGGGAAGATDVVSQVANKVSADLGTPAAPAVPATPAMPPADKTSSNIFLFCLSLHHLLCVIQSLT